MACRYAAVKVNGAKIDLHRHIMEQHLGRKLGRNECVHHINGDPRDNRLENLQVVSRREHVQYHMAVGDLFCVTSAKKVRGERHGDAKLTEQDVRTIRARLDAGETCKAVAEDYPVSRWSISHIKRRVSWAWLDAEDKNAQAA